MAGFELAGEVWNIYTIMSGGNRTDRLTKEVHKKRGIRQYTFIHHTVEHFENRHQDDANPFSPFLLFIPSNMRDDALNCLKDSWRHSYTVHISIEQINTDPLNNIM